jgi:hypothetical protein
VSSSTTLTVAAANNTKTRIERISAVVKDAAYSGSNNEWVLAVIEGTAESGATLENLKGAAAAPASSLTLGYVLVPAKASSLNSGDISNVATALDGALSPGDNTVDDNAIVAGRALVNTTNQYTTTSYTKAELEAGIVLNATRSVIARISENSNLEALTIAGKEVLIQKTNVAVGTFWIGPNQTLIIKSTSVSQFIYWDVL